MILGQTGSREFGDLTSMLEDQDAIAKIGEIGVLGAEEKDRRAPGGGLLYQAKDRAARSDIDAVGRLVKQKNRRTRLKPLG
jgi:hypothetical protein